MKASCSDGVFQKFDQSSGAIRDIFRTYYIDYICWHSPPIVDRLFPFHGLNLFCALKSETDDLFIKLPPVPYRHSKVFNSPVFFFQIKTILSGRVIRIDHVMTGNISDPFIMQNVLCMLLFLSSGPFQMNLYIRIDHSGPQCKCIDIR